MYATDSKSRKKNSSYKNQEQRLLQETSLEQCVPKKKGLIERPACFQEHIKIKKKKKARKTEKEEVKAKKMRTRLLKC